MKALLAAGVLAALMCGPAEASLNSDTFGWSYFNVDPITFTGDHLESITLDYNLTYGSGYHVQDMAAFMAGDYTIHSAMSFENGNANAPNIDAVFGVVASCDNSFCSLTGGYSGTITFTGADAAYFVGATRPTYVSTFFSLAGIGPGSPQLLPKMPMVTTSGVATFSVPEPSTWGLFIAGFGLIGGAMRRRRRVGVTFA